ncbi:MAG: PTS sugar transporter subunit IIA [Treponema sp.]|nr:PTS sugar transporter subunit IIA [Treponema sp.]
MTLSQLLDSRLVFAKTACESKEELITTLVEQIYAIGRKLPVEKDRVLKTILLREQIGGTLLPSGLVIPHARLTDFDDFVLALATPREPLFNKGHQLRMMALMITSHSGVPWYLTTLAALTKISRDEEYFSRLCGAENTEELIRTLREKDTELS